jgi:hypothetical protein
MRYIAMSKIIPPRATWILIDSLPRVIAKRAAKTISKVNITATFVGSI